MKQKFNLLATHARLLTFFVLLCISASAMAQKVDGVSLGLGNDGYVAYIDDDTKTTYTVPSSYKGVPVVEFSDCYNLNVVTINLPSSVKKN